MKKIGFLVSGNGGTLKFLHQAITLFNLHIEISFVIGDRKCGAIEYAQLNDIDNFVIHYKKNQPDELNHVLNGFDDIDIVVTNIHKIIDTGTLKHFKGEFINLHYSLLPAYSGLIGMNTVIKAKNDNALFIGATCHEVTEILDGGLIICQSCFAVNWSCDLLLIYDQVFKSACCVLLNSILLRFENQMEGVKTFSSKYADYNPKLVFNCDLFTDVFWNKIKN